MLFLPFLLFVFVDEVFAFVSGVDKVLVARANFGVDLNVLSELFLNDHWFLKQEMDQNKHVFFARLKNYML